MQTPPSDEVAQHSHRVGQVRRLIRFCFEHNLDFDDLQSGKIRPDMSSICDERGKIVPERIDL